MAQLHDLYIKTDVLETLLKTIKSKNEKGISLTISVNDEVNEYGQNVSSWVSQKQEERNNKKYYVGNGKVFWNNGKISNATKNNSVSNNNTNTQEQPDDLPF